MRNEATLRSLRPIHYSPQFRAHGAVQHCPCERPGVYCSIRADEARSTVVLSLVSIRVGLLYKQVFRLCAYSVRLEIQIK